MEAAAVSMALKVVGKTLASLIIKEYTSIVGAKRDLEDLRDQVAEINGWLETRYEAVWDGPSFNWLKSLKDVTYAVDDVVDEFQLKAEKHAAAAADGGGIISKYMFTKPKSFVLQCKVAIKIKKIKRRFAKIVKQRTESNAIINSIPVNPPVQQTNMTTGGKPTWPEVDVSSIVGRDEDRKYIISKLLKTDHQLKIKIISVIGLGGSGKTTLAKLVFNDGNIKKHFDFTLWVHVSEEFDVDKLVKKMFEAFADNNPGQHDMPSMRKTISEKLNGKRFLLVLDDVWTESQFQWKEFREFLINIGAHGSRILLTTRSNKVAETVGSTDLFMLPLLSKASSWQLFIESYGMAANDLASEFLDVGKEIVDKCGGVPMAIQVLAGVLRHKEHIDQWKATRDSNLLHVEGEEHRVAACLRLSYFHLPFNLKQCFTICSVFPKGHKIDKEQLIDQWIAHDMITPEDGVNYLEYVGHRHFNSLVQMFFLQNVEEVDGRVTCGMHDLVHDLAQAILGDEFSLVVPNEATSSTKSYRYFSLTEYPEHRVPKNTFRKVRAAYVDFYKYDMVLKHAKHLRSVTTRYPHEEVFKVKYLKYLAISKTYCETLPEVISDVWSLQALHVTHCGSLLNLPESLGKLKKLRTLNLSGCRQLKHLPESIGDCQMISSIDLCNCEELTVLPDSIGRNEKLRVLRLSFTKIERLPSIITKLRNLECLDLQGCGELVDFPEGIGNLEKLQVLRLCFTKIERLPSIITTLRNLECLDLQGCGELVDLPEGISNLEKLQVLNLEDCKNLRGMPIGIGQISRLQKLVSFVVGKGEKFAGISELANVSRIGGKLGIRGISHVSDPKDAHMACLKQKTNLQRLNLEWMLNIMERERNIWNEINNGVHEVNAKLEQDVLDGLEPPPGIEELEIHMYSGRQYARWMQNKISGVQGPTPFPFLRVMELINCPNLKHLHGLVELPCLENLRLENMPCLESISGGPFPSLLKLVMCKLPCLGEVWIVAERTMSVGEEVGGCCNFTPQLGQVTLVGNYLTKLKIEDCPKLEVKPHLPPSLQHLRLRGSEQLLQSPGQHQGSSSSPSFSHLKKLQLQDMTGLGSGHGWELLQHFTALESLEISGPFRVQIEVPESLCSLTSLQTLVVFCSNMRVLPKALGELRSLQELTIASCNSLSSLPQSVGQLTSLQLLNIKWCGSLHQLPDCLGELCSLRELEIDCLGLTCLPESICRLTTSLQRLKINDCPGLTSLPQGMGGLVSLQELSFWDCMGLTSLPQGMGGLVSLEELVVYKCPRIQSLPEGIKDLTALKRLHILGCPDLERRCERGKGEDWHLISHIPDVMIW